MKVKNEKLRKARKDRHWSMEEAADQIGISRTTYLRWEYNEQTPHDSSIAMACKAFNMSDEQLGLGAPVSSTNMSLMNISMVQQPTTATEAVNMFSIGIQALILAQDQYGWTPEELHFRAEQEMRRLDTMKQQNGKNFSRRQTLSFLAGLPIALFGLSQTNSSIAIPAEEAIPLYVSSIPACWRLYFDGELLEVATVLPTYISHLSTLAQQTARYQETAASLLSQAHQLGYLLALQDQNFRTAQIHAQQALQYAEITRDPNLRGASLIRLGNLSYTLKRPMQTVQRYQDAVQHIGSASPLLQAQAHMGLAEALARVDNTKEALYHQSIARETLPASPEEDPHYAYTHFNNFTVTNFEGLMYLHLNQPRQAWDAFAQVDKDIPKTLVPQRVELTNRQTSAALALGDMDQTCICFELAVPSALTLGSELRYNEACENYENMQVKWYQEKKVKALAELLHR